MILLVYVIGLLLTLAGVWIWDQQDRLKPGHRPIEVGEWFTFSLAWPITVTFITARYLLEKLQVFLDKQVLFKNKVK